VVTAALDTVWLMAWWDIHPNRGHLTTVLPGRAVALQDSKRETQPLLPHTIKPIAFHLLSPTTLIPQSPHVRKTQD